jgi:hypothetical protein
MAEETGVLSMGVAKISEIQWIVDYTHDPNFYILKAK